MDVVAYIDAGTGSYLLAAIGSGVAGVWFYIRAKLSRLRRGKDGPVQESADE